ncbi:MAG: hypothetical protein M3547_06075, partial [Acidobacteriota bacterium]|nr:hypothetical protein [Acidobacteriota bacterium]
MVSRNRWRPIALGFLIAVTAFGSWGCCTARYCENTAGVVLVSPDDKVSNETIVISKKRKQEILWKLPAESTVQNVAITLGGNPPPFEGCETTEGVCRIPCERRLCSSGAINPGLSPPSGGIYYAYVFQHPAGASSDPGIRID